MLYDAIKCYLYYPQVVGYERLAENSVDIHVKDEGLKGYLPEFHDKLLTLMREFPMSRP